MQAVKLVVKSHVQLLRCWLLLSCASSWSLSTPAARSVAQPLTLRLARYAPQLRFSMGDRAMVAELEALLVGHEDWVHSVAWSPCVQQQQQQQQPPQAAQDGVQPQQTAVSASSAAPAQPTAAQPSGEQQDSPAATAVRGGPDQAKPRSNGTPADQAIQSNGSGAQQAAEDPVSERPQKDFSNGSIHGRRAEPWLMSASMDRTIMLWHPDPATGTPVSCTHAG